MAKLVSRNPATGEVIQELDQTLVEDLPKIFDRAYAAQLHWAHLSVRQRATHLLQLREVILNQADDIIDLISKENGKPKFEAMANEVLPALDTLTFFTKKAPKILKNKTIPL